MSVDLNCSIHHPEYGLDRISVHRAWDISKIRNEIYQRGKNVFLRHGTSKLDLIACAPRDLKIDSDEAVAQCIEANYKEWPKLENRATVQSILGESEPDMSLIHLVFIVRESAESAALAHSPPGSLVDFLRSATLPSRTTVPTTSTKTHGYDTIDVHLFEEDVPFAAIKSETMASLMVNDLFTRVLPDHPVVDDSKLIYARSSAYQYAEYITRESLGHEPSVWNGTHSILYTCIACLDALGLKFRVETQKWNEHANVKMDSVVTSIQNSSGLAVEDKSPKTFGKRCIDENIDALCGNEVLHMQRMERGFRAIFFELTIYMVQEKLRWGLINCGTRMRIVRIEYKEGRPYAIISEEIPADTPPPCSVYSLICYMLLTRNSEISIFEGIRVPTPPPIVKFDGAGSQTRDWVKRFLTVASPGDVTSMVLHTTAAAGRVLVDIPMMRMDKSQTFASDVRSADVHVVDFLGAGSFGRIFLAELSVHGQFYGHVVVKLAKTGLEEYLKTEAEAYTKLRSLYGDGVPRYYGLFSGENAGIRYWCILIDFCGDRVKTIENLPLSQRFEIFRILLMIHRRGVMHNDFSPMNILQTKSGIRLIDFSVAIINHECSGMESCRELIDAATELKLTPLHMRLLLLWSLWLDVYHFTMRMQFSVLIGLTLLAILVQFQFLLYPNPLPRKDIQIPQLSTMPSDFD